MYARGNTYRLATERGYRVNGMTLQPPENVWTKVEEVLLLSVLVLCPLLYSFHQSSFLVPKETYAAVAIAVACAVRYVAGPVHPVLHAGWFGAALASYAIVSAASILWSESWYWSVRSTAGTVLAAVFFVLAAERCRTDRFVARGLAAIAATGVAVAALSALQLAGPARFLFPRFPNNPQIMYSTFGNDSVVAGYIVVAAPLLAGYIVAEDRRWRVAGAVCAAALMVYVLLALQTRSAWAALALAAACVVGMLAFTRRRALLSKAVGPAAILLCCAVLFGALQAAVRGTATGTTTLIERVRSAFDSSQPGVADRIKMTSAAAHIIREHPLAGTGIGTFGFLAPKYQSRVFDEHGRRAALTPSQQPPFYVHNEYVQAVAELGVPGLAVMVALLVTGTRKVTRLWRRTEEPEHDRVRNLLICGGTGTALAVPVLAATHFPFHVITHSLAFLFTMAAFSGYYHAGVRETQQGEATAGASSDRWIRCGAIAVCLVMAAGGITAVWDMAADRLFWDGYMMEMEQGGPSSEALHRLETAARLDPYNGRIAAAYGWALTNRGRWDDALGELTRATESWDTAALHYNLGVVNEELGRPEAAALHYRKAVYRDPGMTDAAARLDALAQRIG